MALKFGSTDLPGEHGPIINGSPEHTTRQVKYFQVVGEGEVVGRPAGRFLAVRLLLHKKYATSQKLQDKLDELSDLVGTNATLKETGNVTRTLPFCTFLGWEPVPNLDEEPGPMLDVAGTLDSNSNGTPFYGWFVNILLRFRQLKRQ